MGQDGHACMASAETSRNSFSVTPLADWTARPFSTVAVYRASVAQSVPAGRSPSCTARSNRCRNAVTIACLNRANSRRTASASSPHASAPDTTRHPRALTRSCYILTNPEKIASTTALAVGLRRASVRNDIGPAW